MKHANLHLCRNGSGLFAESALENLAVRQARSEARKRRLFLLIGIPAAITVAAWFAVQMSRG